MRRRRIADLPRGAEPALMALAVRFELTAREVETYRLVCRGMSNAAMARSLRVTQATVRHHLRNVYRKTRARSHVDLVLLAWFTALEVEASASVSLRRVAGGRRGR